MGEILGAVSMLAQDQYGNYVVQVCKSLHLLQFGLLVSAIIFMEVKLLLQLLYSAVYCNLAFL